MNESKVVGLLKQMKTVLLEKFQKFSKWFLKVSSFPALFIAVAAITEILLVTFRLSGSDHQILLTNTDNARYFLSSVAQSLAALFALVITVSLIIMQLLTQSYTAAIFEIYIKRPKVIIFIVVYAVTILSSLVLLLRLQERSLCMPECIGTDTVLVLTGVSVGWNIFYFFDLLEIVKPKNFIRMMNDRLHGANDRKELLSTIGEVCSISMEKGDLAVSGQCMAVYESIFEKLSADDKGHFYEILNNIFEKAIRFDSPQMISLVLGLSVYRPMSPIWEAYARIDPE